MFSKMIQILIENQESCVVNGSFTTKKGMIERCVKKTQYLHFSSFVS